MVCKEHWLMVQLPTLVTSKLLVGLEGSIAHHWTVSLIWASALAAWATLDAIASSLSICRATM